MSNEIFYIEPTDPTLFDKVDSLLIAYKSICHIPLNQRGIPIKLGKVILSGELNLGPEECIVLDDNGNIIDGFIIARRDEYRYNNKTIYENLTNEN